MPGCIEDKVDHLLMNLKPNMTDNCTFFGSTVLSFILERHTIWYLSIEFIKCF